MLFYCVIGATDASTWRGSVAVNLRQTKCGGQRLRLTRAWLRSPSYWLVLLVTSVSLSVGAAQAQDATWTGPGAEWTTGTNWSSSPNVPSNTATFTNNLAPTAVTISSPNLASINEILFTAAAPAYTFTIGGTLDINGAGIVNDSAFAPGFTVNGRLHFNNTSTAGNATITNNSAGGTFFFNTSTAGNASITNNSGGDTFFDDNSTAGNATITDNSGGSTHFTGASTGGNARFITNAGGVVDMSALTSSGMTAGSIEGAGSYYLGANTLTVGGNGLSTTLSGVISDCGTGNQCLAAFSALPTTGGSLVKVGTGTLTLSGANTYTGGTTLSGGEINVGVSSSGSPGSLTSGPLGTNTLAMSAGTTLGFSANGLTIGNAINVTGDPTFVTTAPSSSPQTISGTITDGASAGSVVVDGGGYITLTGANTYSGGTTICGATATTTCVNTNGTTLIVSTNATFSGITQTSSPIGNGTLIFDGGVLKAGSIVLANTIAINSTGGTIDVANGSSLDYLGTITNGRGATPGTLYIVSSGSGGGELILVPPPPSLGNTFSGATIIGDGTNAVTVIGANGNNVLLPNSAITINNNATLALNGHIETIGSLAGAGNVQNLPIGVPAFLITGGNNASTTFSGVVSDGAGEPLALTKTGSGTMTFTNTETYSGATTINGGTLTVNGSIADSSGVAINSGGTLAGNGTVSATQVSGGGTLAPGNPSNPTGTLMMTGSLTFQSAAMYMITVNGANASNTSVTGSATLAGIVQVAFASGPTAKSYDILHSAGLGGTTFGGVTAPNYNASLSYSATDTDVLLNINGAALGNTSVLNQNQQAVANAISASFNSGGTLPSSFAALFGLTGSNLANALMQLDGEAATDAEKGAFELMNQFLGLMLDPFVDGRFGSGGGPIGFAPDQQASFPPDIALAYASVLKAPPAQSFDQRWTAWGSGFGASSTTNGNAAIGSNNVTAADYGFAGGMDYHATPSTLYGFALAGAGTNWNLVQGLGTGRSDAFQAGVYGKSYWGPAYVAAALAFTNNWFSTNRTALGDEITANFAGQSYGGRLETGYRYGMPTGGTVLGVTPYAAIQTQWFHTPTYSETDLAGGGLGLTYNAMTANDTRSELGARFDDPTLLNGMPLILRARFAWAHDWVSNPSLDAAFQSLPGSSFVVNGATPPKDSALASAGAQYFLSAAWSFTAKFDGEFASNSQTYGGSGTLRYTW